MSFATANLLAVNDVEKCVTASPLYVPQIVVDSSTDRGGHRPTFENPTNSGGVGGN